MEIQKRGIKLSDYNISRSKYNELKYFCMQYEEKKKEIIAGNQLRARDVELIEQTAIAADANIYQYILKNVTEGIPYEYMNVPCGRRQFYEARRMFFIKLATKR